MWSSEAWTKSNSKAILHAVSHLKDTAQHTKDAAGAKYDKNMAEAKQHLKSGEHPELEAQKEAAKSQEKASTAAAKGHATDVRHLAVTPAGSLH